MQNWIAALKKLPESEKQKIVHQLPEMMAVHVPKDAFGNIMMSWDHAREMSENGIEMGAHTVSHPILTRISIEETSQELINCKRHIEAQINRPALRFAYPNGQAGDFNTEIMKKVQQTGFEAAFTLLPGPTQKAEVLKNPLAIRRIFLSHRDTFPRFVAKLVGLDRINAKPNR
jgi:peptidoglycan/xylan/chitin deacetylase (PgdA/CDA1 family)